MGGGACSGFSCCHPRAVLRTRDGTCCALWSEELKPDEQPPIPALPLSQHVLVAVVTTVNCNSNSNCVTSPCWTDRLSEQEKKPRVGAHPHPGCPCSFLVLGWQKRLHRGL